MTLPGRFDAKYTVRAGDVLARIARRFGTSLRDLLAANPQIRNPDLIRVGEVINVPAIGAPDSLQPITRPDIEDDDDIPLWMAIAQRELETGVREFAGAGDNPRIVEYHSATSLASRPAGKQDETAWCSSFVNFCVQQSGLKGTKSAMARSWLKWRDGTAIDEPKRGCVVVFSRPPKPQHGHVGFFVKEKSDRIIVLGGNQNDQVSMKGYDRDRLLRYLWPKEAPPPPVPPGDDFSAAKDWSKVDEAERQRRVMHLLTDQHGYPVNGAAGIVGNLMAESAIIPNRIEGSTQDSPMRAPDLDAQMRTWTAEEIMSRAKGERGPKLPGVGLAQWTSHNRRAGLFEHVFNGDTLGAGILFDMDAQVDYLVDELRTDFPPVDRILRQPHVTIEVAADEAVQVFRQRRGLAHAALEAFQPSGEEPAPT